MLNSSSVAQLDNERLRRQLLSLERKTGRGRDVIDHPRGLQDDLANAVGGALINAKLSPAATSVPGFPWRRASKSPTICSRSPTRSLSS
jgi:hypothetical protein